MKRTIATLLVSAALALGLSGAALAQHRGDFRGGFHRHFHGRFYGGFGTRLFVGPYFYDPFWYDPFWRFYYPGPAFYYSPYYYSPYSYYPAYRAPSTEAEPSLPSGPGQYYCNNPSGYYPSLKSCNTPWEFVPAHPPS